MCDLNKFEGGDGKASGPARLPKALLVILDEVNIGIVFKTSAAPMGKSGRDELLVPVPIHIRCDFSILGQDVVM